MQQGIECLNSCIFNWLRQDFIQIKMSDIFFLGQGLNMHYTGSYGSHMIYTEQYKANIRFVKKYAENSIWDNCVEEENDKKKEFLIDLIKRYSRVIIRVSSSNLPYNKRFVNDKVISHYIMITGYENGSFKVHDGCPPAMDIEIYEGEISEKDLISNWEIMNCEYLVLQYKKETFANERIRKKVINSRNTQIRKYLNKNILFSGGRYSGNRCFVSLLEDMEEIFKHNTFEIKEIVAECNRQLKIEGFEQSKLFILDSISNNDAGKENGKSVVEKYEKIVHRWNKLILTFLKAGIKKDYMLFSQVLEEARVLTTEETNILSEIL